uniref:NADH dehydrogenase subunit 2 n=1 Tax=Anoplocephala perfoliata TaxID=218192 RepID=A0A0N7DJN5_9CEST|nr:NADH dehydrogenase subunit 2 [Anoplocephala perfoliata]AKU46908.1 NADH dehydrogenase subunit 2 [Anoplocephala perfoliata]
MTLHRFYSDLVFFSFFFSILFCFLCSLVDSLLGFWVFLELGGLSIIPCFFYGESVGFHGFYNSLLTYIIMSGISSVLLVSGILFLGLYLFVYFGFLVKFGLFPFSLWVYRVFSSSNWFFIFCLSVILKFPILFFCFLFQNYSLALVYGDCFLTIAMCTFFVWWFSQDWSFIWCHISLVSVSTLLVGCFCSDVELCFFVYFYYFVWSIMCIVFFFNVGDEASFFSGFWVFAFLLLVTPFSFPLFYKLGVCVTIFYSSFYVLFIWSLYSFSEQFFLYKLGGDYFYSGVFNRWL